VSVKAGTFLTSGKHQLSEEHLVPLYHGMSVVAMWQKCQVKCMCEYLFMHTSGFLAEAGKFWETLYNAAFALNCFHLHGEPIRNNKLSAVQIINLFLFSTNLSSHKTSKFSHHRIFRIIHFGVLFMSIKVSIFGIIDNENISICFQYL
jgi:hypothetical protein